MQEKTNVINVNSLPACLDKLLDEGDFMLQVS